MLAHLTLHAAGGGIVLPRHFNRVQDRLNCG
jgi:hypothetical protein